MDSALQRQKTLEEDDAMRSRTPAEETADAIDGLEAQIVQQGMLGAAKSAAESQDKKNDKTTAKSLATKALVEAIKRNPYVMLILAVVIIFFFVFIIVFSKVREIQDNTGVSIQGICESLGSSTCIKEIINKGGDALKSNAN